MAAPSGLCDEESTDGAQTKSTDGAVRHRARLLAGALVVESVGGLQYAFSLYSETLKRTYGLSQGAVQAIGTAANVGGNVGVHVGLFYDALGARATASLALLLGGVGWGGMWLVLATAWPAPLGLLIGLGATQGHAQMVADCAVVPTVARAFRAEQFAVALGLAKALVGLSGSLAAQLYAAFFARAPPHVDGGVASFLGALALWFCAACAVGVATLGTPAPKGAAAERAARGPMGAAELRASDAWLGRAYCLMLCLVAVLVGSALRQEQAHAAAAGAGAAAAASGVGAQRVFSAVALCVLGALLLLVGRGPAQPRARPHPGAGLDGAQRTDEPREACGSGWGGRRRRWVGAWVHAGGAEPSLQPLRTADTAAAALESGAEEAAARAACAPAAAAPAGAENEAAEAGAPAAAPAGEAVAAAAAAPPAGAYADGSAGEGLPLWAALLSADFALHFFTHFAIAGGGFFLINNLAQVLAAVEPEAHAGAGAASLVSLLSACNCAGRLGAASLCECAARAGLPRTAPFALSAALMAASMGCVAAHSRAALLPACALCGLAFGGLNALNAVVVRPLYGLRSFGAVYTAIVLAGAAGSAAISSGLAVRVYNGHLAPGATVCVGRGCFGPTALVCAALNAGGCAAALLLSARVRARDRAARRAGGRGGRAA